MTNERMPSDEPVITPASGIMAEETAGADRLTQIYREDFESLHGALCRLKHNRLSPEDAQEALQNAFLVLSERHRRDGFWPDDVRSWLVRVAVIQSRRKARRPAVSLDRPAGVRSSFEVALSRVLADPLTKGPSTVLSEEETLSLIKMALEELSDDVREIVQSHVLEGKSFAEIAGAQGLSEENAKKICQRGLSQLHESMGRHSSSMVPEADANTYQPRTRRGALEALGTLPREYARMLEARYDSGLSLEQCAALEGITAEAAQSRLARAEELFHRKYGLSTEDLIALLRKAS